MTDDFDDPDLAAARRNIAGPVPSVEAALPVFHRRVRVARIRRVSVAVSGAAAVALIAVGAVALTGNERGNNITPMDASRRRHGAQQRVRPGRDRHLREWRHRVDPVQRIHLDHRRRLRQLRRVRRVRRPR